MKELVAKLLNKTKKYAKDVKKAWRKLRYLDKTQLNYYIVTGFIGIFCVFTGSTYAAFTLSTYASVGNITIAKLSYNLEIEGCTYGNNYASNCTYNNNTGNAYPYVTVPANTTVFVDMSLTSLNNNHTNYTSRAFNTKYAINQSKVNTGVTAFASGDNVSVYYSQNNPNNMTGQIGPYGSEITPLRIVIVNANSSSKTVYLTSTGGYVQNTITSNITSGYYERDMTIRTVVLDEDFSLYSQSTTASFPINTSTNAYAYLKTECTEPDATATWDNDNWEISINSSSSVSCDVYFKKMCTVSGSCSDIEIVYQVTDKNGNKSYSDNSPDDSYIYKGYTCNNDATLSTPTWNSTTNAWTFNVSGVDGLTLCTAYFGPDNSLSNYIISKYGTDANLYYHTTDTTKYSNGEDEISSTNASSETDTYANLNAGDDSYRYSGANPNNYVCFGTDSEATCKSDTSKYLYRIIGVFENGEGKYLTKIVSANSLANSPWDYAVNNNVSAYSNEWSNASLKQWLNGETLKAGSESNYPTSSFLSNYTSAWTNKIAASTWYVRGLTSVTLNAKGIYTDEIANVKNSVSGYTTNYQGNSAILTNTKVGLMYISDYMYASSPNNWNFKASDYSSAATTNWLVSSEETWPVSPIASYSYLAWIIRGSVYAGEYSYVLYNKAVRPVVYLASDIEIDTSATSADGSASHPYILKVN